MAGNVVGEPIVIDSSNDSSAEEQFSDITVQTVIGETTIDSALTEESSVLKFQNLVGFHVSKRYAGEMHEGVVASCNDVTQMFKVEFFNGYSEEMALDDLVSCLVPVSHPVHPNPSELPGIELFVDFTRFSLTNYGATEAMAPTAPALPTTEEIGSSEKIPTGALDNQVPGADHVPPAVTEDVSSPRKGCTSKIRRSSRNHKLVAHYSGTTASEDEEPNYPLAPIIKVPWADKRDGKSTGAARGMPKKRMRTNKLHTTSLRIRASYYPGDGHEMEDEELNGDNES